MKWFLRALGIAFLTLMFLYGFAFLIIFSMRSAQATYRIETREAHPDYVFILRTECYRWEAGNGWKGFNEVRFAEINPENPLVIEVDQWPEEVVEGTEWRERTFLGTVPRSTAAQYKTAKECDDAARASEEESFYWNRPVPPWYSKGARITVKYRVQPKQSGDGLEIVQTSRSPLWQWAIILIAGLWFVTAWLVKSMFWPPLAPAADGISSVGPFSGDGQNRLVT